MSRCGAKRKSRHVRFRAAVRVGADIKRARDRPDYRLAMARDHWLHGFNYNVEEWDARGVTR